MCISTLNSTRVLVCYEIIQMYNEYSVVSAISILLTSCVFLVPMQCAHLIYQYIICAKQGTSLVLLEY